MVVDAIKELSNLSRKLQNHKLIDQINHLSETFRYMAKFMVDGIEDPSREETYSDIIARLRSINDRIRRDVSSIDSNDFYSETLRYTNLRNRPIDVLFSEYSTLSSELSLAKAAGNDSSDIQRLLESLQTEIFNTIWVSLGDQNLTNKIVKIISSGNLEESFSIFLINALVLGLLNYFDPYKLTALLDLYEAEISEKITSRSLVGIVLTLKCHPERSIEQKSTRLRLDLMKDSLLSYARLREIVMAIIRTRDTERVATKMKDDVLPEIMKLRPEILKKFREGSVDNIENNMLEGNPEWEDLLDKAGLTEKMRELSEMQSEGADLMMVAFSNLKQFPFFNIASNWFLPFDVNYSAIIAGERERNLLENIMTGGRNICDSDKYSLAIALSKMPDSQKEIMMNQLDMQFSQMQEEKHGLDSSTPEFDEEVTKFIRDLYRFFKLFRKREGFIDPFAKPFNFIDLPMIGELMSDSEVLTIVGEFYFKRKFYEEALSFFEHLSEENPNDPALLEKIGFCYQSLKLYKKALDSYKKAELLREPSQWLLRNLAFVNKKSENYRKAFECYSKLLENDHENLNLLVNTAFCALEAGDISTALQHYYHANYLDPENLNILRAIAWAELLNHNVEKSEKYYGQILSISEDVIDYLNAGHLYLAKKDYPKAIEMYKKAVGTDLKEFESAYLKDMDLLNKIGVDSLSAHILLDYMKL